VSVKLTKAEKTAHAEVLDTLSFSELEELDQLAEQSFPNAQEFVAIYSKNLQKTVHIQRIQVYKYASFMSRPRQIAELLGIDDETLLSYFKTEIRMGHAFGRQKLITRFYHLAVYGNNPADRIFALKNWANMTDDGLKEELMEVDEGVEFVIRRPKTQLQTAYDVSVQTKLTPDPNIDAPEKK
jgi:hypothetical protein